MLATGCSCRSSHAAIDRHIEFGAQLPSLLSTMHLYPINGAAGRAGRNDTAWSFREAVWGSVIAGIDPIRPTPRR